MGGSEFAARDRATESGLKDYICVVRRSPLWIVTPLTRPMYRSCAQLGQGGVTHNYMEKWLLYGYFS